MEKEFFVDNSTIKEKIKPAYEKVINVMKTKLNHAEKYNEIYLRPRESRIMFEILRFHPEFETKWTKGCKFVYAISQETDGKPYSDVFIKYPQGNHESFSKKKIITNLTNLEKNFKSFMKTNPDLIFLNQEINNRKELGLCTKIFGTKKEVNPNIRDFVFCDCCLARTNYNEYKCSNPLDQHDTIDKKLVKPEYEQGIAATNVDEDDNRFSKYYITKDTINIPNCLTNEEFCLVEKHIIKGL